MASIGKISVGVNTKKYSHTLNHHVNTTCEFGIPQPIFCRFMQEDDKVRYKNHELVRFNSLVAPTFGECNSINVARFVPMCDIFPAYDALLSQQPIKPGISRTSYIPTSYPVTTNSILVLWLMNFCYIEAWNKAGEKIPLSSFPGSDNPARLKYLYRRLLDWFSGKNLITNGSVNFLYERYNAFFQGGFHEYASEHLTLENADYIFFNPSYDGDISIDSFPDDGLCCLTFHFTQAGKRIATIFRGLGYNLEPTNCDKVNVLPLLAYYKAWFDLYQPKRNINWHDSKAYMVINHCYSYGSYNLIELTTENNDIHFFAGLFFDFLYDFVSLPYGLKDDWFSVHRSNPNNPQSVNHLPNTSPAIGNTTTNNLVTVPEYDNVNKVPYVSSLSGFNQVTLDVLRRLTRFMNKNSIIGKNVQKYIAVHYGAKTAEDMFSESYNIGQFVVNCIPHDIMSSADTVTVDSEGNTQGSYTGQYAGYCRELSTGSFTFKANSPGFLMVITTVVPVAEYYQGCDGQLYCYDRFTLPNSLYDAVGYQVTPTSQMYDNSGVCDFKPAHLLGNNGFGFVPYMSSYKVRQNLVNGDFRNRSTSASYEPYFLDRKITTSLVTKDPTHRFLKVQPFSIPKASPAWRLAFGDKALGNFDRIFNNQTKWLTMNVDDPYTYGLFGLPTADNIILQCNVKCSHTNCTKPLSMSFDTFEETMDNKSVSVDPE